MKTRRALRYSCDYCRKSGCKKDAIQDHEKMCFCNPSRVCRLCQNNDLTLGKQAIEGITLENEEEKIKAVLEAVDHCPACALSVFYQTPHAVESYAGWDGHEATYKRRWGHHFDYKTARDEWISENTPHDLL